MIALALLGWLVSSVAVGLAFGAICRVGLSAAPSGNKSRDAILEVAGQGGR